MQRLVFALLLAGAASQLAAQSPAEPKTIVFFGDSLTAGYGLDPTQAYPAQVQKKLRASDFPYRVVNAGVSGETSSAGLRRVDWILRQKVDVFVLALGANDGLRGIPPEATRENLAKILTRVRQRYPQAKLVVAGMQLPVNYGESYRDEFADIFPSVAAEQQATLIPFLLEGVGGRPEFNLPDGIHPSAEGQRRVAATVWKFLRTLL